MNLVVFWSATHTRIILSACFGWVVPIPLQSGISSQDTQTGWSQCFGDVLGSSETLLSQKPTEANRCRAPKRFLLGFVSRVRTNPGEHVRDADHGSTRFVPRRSVKAALLPVLQKIGIGLTPDPYLFI